MIVEKQGRMCMSLDEFSEFCEFSLSSGSLFREKMSIDLGGPGEFEKIAKKVLQFETAKRQLEAETLSYRQMCRSCSQWLGFCVKKSLCADCSRRYLRRKRQRLAKSKPLLTENRLFEKSKAIEIDSE